MKNIYQGYRLYNRKLVLVFIAFLLGSATLKAAWVENIPTKVKNPDGSIIECFATGDEFFNYLHDEDGFTIIAGDDGFYYYAISNGDVPIASQYRVGEVSPAKVGLQPRVGISEGEYQRRKDEMLSVFVDDHGRSLHSGTLNNIVIYIRFADDSEFTTNRSVFDGRLNNTNPPSVKSYFQEVSYGMITVESHHFPPSEMNTNLSYQDIYPRSYFEPYHATNNPNGYTSSERTSREHQLLHRAVTAVADQIPEDLEIDSDNNNRVDNVSFIIKGGTSGWGSILWAHRWALYTTQTFINGKRVWDYTFQPETQATVTILNHELFHTFGAPDLYRYYNNTITPVGPWDLMHSGSGHMGAFMKWKYTNNTWIEDIPVISEPGTYTLNPLTLPDNNAFRVNSPNSSTEYFILEYRRKQSGTYDNNLPGSGLLVYRINTSAGNGNANGPPDEVYIYRPNGTNTVNGSINSAHFSSQINRTEINDQTNPSSFLSNNSAGGLDISNISEAGNTISFDLFGGSTSNYNISLNANPGQGGTVSGGGTFPQGQSITVTATAADNFTFSNWTENGSVVSSNASYSFTVTANRSLTANFSQNSYAVTTASSPQDGGTTTGAGNYSHGQTAMVNATPATGYTFTNWTENGSMVSSNASYSFTVTANRSLTANFQFEELETIFTISANAQPSGSAFINGAGDYFENQMVTLSATPLDENFVFIGWVEKGKIISTDNPWLFPATENVSLTARFRMTPRSFDISLSVNLIEYAEVLGSGNYQEGSHATIEVYHEPNTTFVGWKNAAGQIISRANPYIFPVNRSIELEAILNIKDEPVFTDDVSIKVFPNPSDGKFTVNVEEDAILTISNFSSLIVLQITLYQGDNSIDISWLPTGMYLLNFEMSGRTWNRKVVIK